MVSLRKPLDNVIEEEAGFSNDDDPPPEPDSDDDVEPQPTIAAEDLK